MKNCHGNRPNGPARARSSKIHAIPHRCKTQRLLRGLVGVLLVLTAALAGCGSEAGQNNHGYGWEYDQEGPTGLRVRYDGYATPALAQIEALFLETEACTGIKATGPLVIFAHDTFTNASYGWTFFDTGTILISTLIDPDPLQAWWIYKHEFIHYLLHQSGFPIDQNAAHQSPLFSTCTQPPA